MTKNFVSQKVKNKNEALCMKIVSCLSEINKKPIETKISDTSFSLSYDYAKGQLMINGKNFENNRAKSIDISYSINNYIECYMVMSKSDCTWKNIFEVLTTILKDDNLPRCPKCSSRPKKYHEYTYGKVEIDADEKSLPVLNCFCLFDLDDETLKKMKFISAECFCGNQWKLKGFSSIFDIHNAYKEGDK